MINQANPTPAWRAYADQVVQKLLASRRRRALVANPLAALNVSDSDVEPYDLSELELPAAADEPPPAASPDPAPGPAERPRPVPELSPRSLSLTIRLAATLEREAAMRAACAPEVITVIHGLTPEELEPVRRIVSEGFLPDDVHAHDDLRRAKRDRGDRALVLLAPDVWRGSDDRIARRRFLEALKEAMNLSLPILLLLPDTGMLPETLQDEVHLLRLAPLSRDVLVAHLGHSHGIGAAEEPAIHAALPPDRLLATMPGTALLLALRAADARDMVARLTRLTAPAAKDGPSLETMRGDSPVLSAARRLVADLRDWQAERIGWGDLSRSLLLYGPPGIGKTYLARAIGSSAGIAMVTGSFAAWQAAGHLGDMLRAMRQAFAEARRQTPAMLFVDEIDAVGSREDGDRHGSSYRLQVINAFLAEMDSIAR